MTAKAVMITSNPGWKVYGQCNCADQKRPRIGDKGARISLFGNGKDHVAVELQITQEYTGQQRDRLPGNMWKEVLILILMQKGRVHW